MGSTILDGDWKYYQGYGLVEDALYNLKDDPLEKSNVIDTNPELASKLRTKLNAWLTRVSATRQQCQRRTAQSEKLGPRDAQRTLQLWAGSLSSAPPGRAAKLCSTSRGFRPEIFTAKKTRSPRRGDRR